MVAALAGYARRHHIGLIALFIALGGTAYAASLPRNSVGPKQLKRNAVSSPKIQRGAVTAAKVRDGSLSAAEFAPGTLLTGPPGERGPQGPAGSDAQFDGATAGGALAGTYPSPTLRAGVVTPDAIGAAPAVQVVGGGAIPQQLPLNTNTAIVFDQPTFETVEMFDSTQPQWLTVPRPGLYEVIGQVTFAPNANGRRTVGIGFPGGCCFGLQSAPPVTTGAAFTVLQASALLARDTGDRVQLFADQDGSGGPLAVLTARLSMRWVGPLP